MKRRKRPEPVAPQNPVLLGWKLASARKSRKLSIEDAAHATHIPAERLRWLESGNLAAFGNLTYARSFLRAYSGFLEVDDTALMARLPAKGVLGGRCDYRYLTESHGAWLREWEPAPAGCGTAADAFTGRRISSPLPAALATFLITMVGTALWGMHLMETGSNPAQAELRGLAREAPLVREAGLQPSQELSYVMPVAGARAAKAD